MTMRRVPIGAGDPHRDADPMTRHKENTSKSENAPHSAAGWKPISRTAQRPRVRTGRRADSVALNLPGLAAALEPHDGLMSATTTTTTLKAERDPTPPPGWNPVSRT